MKLLGKRSLSSLMEITLGFFWIGTWFVAVLFAVLPFAGLENTNFTFTVPITHGLSDEKDGPGGTWTLTTVAAAVSTPHGYTWVGSLVALPFVVLLAFVFGQLLAIFRSLREGSPFIAQNARRLRRIGLAILLMEGLRVLVMLVVVEPVIEKLRPLARGAVIQTSVWPSMEGLFLGFSVLILAEVFRRGTRMQEEQALTV
jgi:hypothetical protein